MWDRMNFTKKIIFLFSTTVLVWLIPIVFECLKKFIAWAAPLHYTETQLTIQAISIIVYIVWLVIFIFKQENKGE